MKKLIKYLFGILAVMLVLFLSLDLKKLDEYQAEHHAEAFNADKFARDVWVNRIPAVIEKAPAITSVVSALRTDPERAFKDMGRKLGISKTWYFMAKGAGTIESVEEDYLRVQLDSQLQVELATAFIFGNAVRDGSGVVDINDFVNMTDFNQVSISLNRLVKEEVVPLLVGSARPGMNVEFTGAFEIVEDQIDLDSIRVIPVSVNLTDGSRQ